MFQAALVVLNDSTLPQKLGMRQEKHWENIESKGFFDSLVFLKVIKNRANRNERPGFELF
ncbi:MAG: hypothetical protein AAF204_02835 [Pseudomonadota bacterium]